MIRRVAGFLFLLYCTIPLLASLVVVIPCYALIFNFSDKSKGPGRAHRLSRWWASFLLTFFFIRLRISGKEKIDPARTYVFIANHRSLLDIPAYALSCSNTFRFLSKAELTKIPLLGYVIRNLYITVNRSDKRDRHRSIEKMLNSIREGISVFLAPEGTRNTGNSPLLDFKDGAFRLAIAAQQPIAVLVLHDTAQRLSPHRPFELYPGTIRGEWIDVYETHGMTDADMSRLKEEIHLSMSDALLQKTTS